MKIDEYKQTHDLISVIGQLWGVTVEEGKNICCQKHDDRNPSFGVYRKNGELYWKCFGACQAGGDVIDFVMWATGQTHTEVLAGDALTHTTKPVARRLRLKGKATKDYQFTADMLTMDDLAKWHDNLDYFPEAQAFLKARGVSEKTQLLHQVGYTGSDARLDRWQQNKIILPYFRDPDTPAGYKLRALNEKTYLKMGRTDLPYGSEFFWSCDKPYRLIVEGELDALLLNSLLDCSCAIAFPAGVKLDELLLSLLLSWGGHYINLVDNDEAGHKQAERLHRLLYGRFEAFLCPDGSKDIGDFFKGDPLACGRWVRWIVNAPY